MLRTLWAFCSFYLTWSNKTYFMCNTYICLMRLKIILYYYPLFIWYCFLFSQVRIHIIIWIRTRCVRFVNEHTTWWQYYKMNVNRLHASDPVSFLVISLLYHACHNRVKCIKNVLSEGCFYPNRRYYTIHVVWSRVWSV